MTAMTRRFSIRTPKAWAALSAALLLPLVVIDGGVAASPAAASAICWVGPAVVRGNVWLLANGYGSRTASRSFSYGRAGDQPFFGAWDAFSVDSAPGVVRGATWYLRRTQSTGPADITFTYGRVGDIHVVGDWNGDGIDTPGVVRGQTWYLRNSNSAGPADVTFTFSAQGTPTVFNLAGVTWVATFNAGTWSARSTPTTGPANFMERWGQAGDIPVGGGLYVPAPDCTSPSLAVVRGNVWHISGNAPNQGTTFGFGRAGDQFLSQHY